jgi:Phage P22-like portal protein
MPRPKRGDAEIMREARARFEQCSTWETVARHRARLDRKFANGDVYNGWQWMDEVRNARGDRPSLTHNKVRQHNLAIINDMRQNKTSVKVTPTGGSASYDAAQVFEGIIRRIEYQSVAVDAYTTATFHQVEAGIGYVTVDCDYVDEGSFEQEIYIRRVSDPETIYMDPDAKLWDKSDMRYAFVFEDIPREQWEDEHGKNAAPPPAALDMPRANNWVTKDHVRIAIYWRRNEDTDKLHLLHDGRVLRASEMDDAQSEVMEPLIAQTRETTEATVEWFRIEGDEIVDRGDWAGKYIPVVPFIGEETVIDGILDRKGHTRSQIDAQRIYNYWASAAVEQVALQGKTPYIGPMQAFEGFEDKWSTANIKNWAWLPYNAKDDNGQPVPPPQRAPAPEMAQAYVQGMMIARQDLLDVTGQYQAELGMPSNERSGVAIQQRQRQGDNATYHYIDNQAKAIRQIGRILIDLIPKIYDTTRVMRILAEDGSDTEVILTPGAPAAHQRVRLTPQGPVPIGPDQADADKEQDNAPDPRIIFNPNVGRYDVEADVGPSFGTQRQEAGNAFTQILANNPAAFQVVGDFWAQYQDFPGAEELAERLKRGLPPQYKPGPDPQVIKMQQAGQQMQQQAQALLRQADAEIARLKADNVRLKEQALEKHGELVIDEYKAETDRLKAVGSVDPLALQVIVRRLVSDMLQENMPGWIAHHGALEQQLQANVQAAQPQQPMNGGGGNGNGGNGAAQPQDGSGMVPNPGMMPPGGQMQP